MEEPCCYNCKFGYSYINNLATNEILQGFKVCGVLRKKYNMNIFVPEFCGNDCNDHEFLKEGK